MKLKGKLKAIIKVTYSEHMDTCGSREESTQLFYKKSSRGVHKYGGDLSGRGAGGTRRGSRTAAAPGIAVWAGMLHLEKR